MQNIIPALAPAVLPSCSTALESIVALFNAAFPPVKGKLLAWHPGQLETGYTYVQSTNALGEPEYNALGEPEMEISGSGTFRKDSAKALGDFPLLVTHSHCADFDGSTRKISTDLSMNSDSSGYLECEFEYNDSGNNEVLISSGGESPNRCYLAVTTNDVLGGAIGGQYYTTIFGTTTLVDGTTYVAKLTWDGMTVTLYLDGVVEYTNSQVGTPDTSTDCNIGFYLTGTETWFSGKLWRADFNSTVFALAEGSGSTVYSTNGLHSGTITGSLWGSYQDVYPYNALNGYWDNGDGVKYPTDPGSATFMPGRTWNYSENIYSYGVIGEPAPADIATQDALEGGLSWVDGSGNALGKTQLEIEADVVGLEAEFMKDCPSKKIEHLVYSQLLTGDELFYVMEYSCDAEAVTDADTGIIVTDEDTGFIVYEEI